MITSTVSETFLLQTESDILIKFTGLHLVMIVQYLITCLTTAKGTQLVVYFQVVESLPQSEMIFRLTGQEAFTMPKSTKRQVFVMSMTAFLE